VLFRSKKLQADYSARFAAHRDAITLDPRLFARIKTLHDARDTLGLDAQGVRLVEEYYKDFVRAGAALDDTQKARLKEINAELARLGTTFSQNVLAEVNDSAVVVDTAEELRSEEHTSELQSRENLVCRLLLEKKNK